MQDFSLSQLRKYTGGCIHFARKRYLGTEESTCLRNYVIFGFAHERDLRITGVQSAGSDWWEVACHLPGRASSASEQRGDSHRHGK